MVAPVFKIVSVIGAGQMGSGIAQVCAVAGYTVHLIDTTLTQLQQARLIIDKNLQILQTKTQIPVTELSAIKERIKASTVLSDTQAADLIIEAIPEDLALKSQLLKNISQQCKKTTIIASNTSSISITKLASHCHKPEQMVGLHFMNPVPLIPLVEIIPGLRTKPAITAYMQDFSQRLGKTAIVVRDSPGFGINRILIPMINEAIFAVYEGMGTPSDIDAIMRLGANHPLGPLALADLIGLDTCLSIMHVLHAEFGDGKYRPCPLLVHYVDAGWLGRKSGRGFYEYPPLNH